MLFIGEKFLEKYVRNNIYIYLFFKRKFLRKGLGVFVWIFILIKLRKNLLLFYMVGRASSDSEKV